LKKEYFFGYSFLYPLFYATPSSFVLQCRDTTRKIYQLNDFLPKLNALIPWEIFRSTLEKVREKERLTIFEQFAFPGGLNQARDRILEFRHASPNS